MDFEGYRVTPLIRKYQIFDYPIKLKKLSDIVHIILFQYLYALNSSLFFE